MAWSIKLWNFDRSLLDHYYSSLAHSARSLTRTDQWSSMIGSIKFTSHATRLFFLSAFFSFCRFSWLQGVGKIIFLLFCFFLFITIIILTFIFFFISVFDFLPFCFFFSFVFLFLLFFFPLFFLLFFLFL